MQLHNVNNTGNSYCGPAVVSALTQCTGGAAARIIRTTSGRVRVTGTHIWHLGAALAACNITYHSTPYRAGSTLAQWLKSSKPQRTPGRVFLIGAGNHWQLVSGRRFVCGRVREVCSIKAPGVKRRCRVSEVYELKVAPGKRIIIPSTAHAPKPTPGQRAAVRLRKLTYNNLHARAAAYGIDVDAFNAVDSDRIVAAPWRDDEWWVVPPEGMHDPYEHEHICYDFEELEDRVNTYIQTWWEN